MDSSVFVRSASVDLVVKQILTIACHNHAETMEFAMIQLPVILVNVHPVILDSRAKRISTIANRHHATEAPVLMEIIHLHVNATQDTPVNFAKHKSMNVNQVSELFLVASFSMN